MLDKIEPELSADLKEKSAACYMVYLLDKHFDLVKKQVASQLLEHSHKGIRLYGLDHNSQIVEKVVP